MLEWPSQNLDLNPTEKQRLKHSSATHRQVLDIFFLQYKINCMHLAQMYACKKTKKTIKQHVK